MPTPLETALALEAAGLPVVIVRANQKRPTDNDWQHRRPTAAKLTTRYTNNPALNVGVVLGPGSVVDIECDSPESPTDLAELFTGCEMPRTPTYSSKRGAHRLFAWDERLAVIGKAVAHYKTVEIRLGTGGKGAQSLLPPSTTDGVTREWTIPLSAECPPAKLPDLVIERIIEASKQQEKPKPAPQKLDRSKPGDDYCARGPTWHEILSPHGWKYIGESNGVQGWRRPGKDDEGLSATTGYCASEAGRDLFYCFTSNAPPFAIEQTYNKFSVYALLNHGGDFKAAAAALAADGYGEQRKQRGSAKLIDLAADAELFHTPAGDEYATVAIADHCETYAVKSTRFKQYLQHQFYLQTKSAPSQTMVAEAVDVLAARAKFEGPEIPVFTRLAGANGAIYLDLANDKSALSENRVLLRG
jgi:hypothetical protein